MLDRIADNSSHVVTPVIESILDDTFKFVVSENSGIQIGVFTWNLLFQWKLPSARHKGNGPTKPIRFDLMCAM